MKKIQTLAFVFGFLAFIFGALAFYRNSSKPKILPTADSFEECVAQGNPVMESYPRQCRTRTGQLFVEVIGEAQPITVLGELVCLPHRDTTGPQTLECAYGLHANQDIFYGLSDPEMKFIPTLPMGEKVTIEGNFRTETDLNSKYNTVGTIEILDVIQTAN